MANLRTRGVIIKKTARGEADVIFTILTNDRGKLRVMAKGVRRGRAKLAGYLDLLRCNDFELVGGKNLDIVTGAATVANFGAELEDLTAFGIKLHLCELVDKLIEEEAPARGVYELLVEALSALQVKTLPVFLVKSYFELRFLSLLGMTPEIRRSVVTGETLNATDRLFFSSQLGGVVKENEAQSDGNLILLSVNALKLLRALLDWPPEKLARLNFEPAVVSEIEYIVADYLNYSLEYRPKSLRVLGELG
jgi:DNA repair protein RecO (recombination protein O)